MGINEHSLPSYHHADMEDTLQKSTTGPLNCKGNFAL